MAPRWRWTSPTAPASRKTCRAERPNSSLCVNDMSIPIAGDVDYATHGLGYGRQRRTDPRLAAWVHAALGDARSVLNVGAGAGSYEPTDRHVLAIEPSAAMRAQRPPHRPAIVGFAENLPLDDQ